jgi:hypothetical protein
MVGMLATARLLNDESKVNAVLFGGNHAIPVLAPWTHLFDHLTYGQSDGPAPGCVNNHELDSQSSLDNHHDYQTLRAAPGEIADRFRNAKSGQGIGYPMFTLERLFDAAELMQIAGFDPYGYRGAHRQSIEMAVQYYACFARGAGFYSSDQVLQIPMTGRPSNTWSGSPWLRIQLQCTKPSLSSFPNHAAER